MPLSKSRQISAASASSVNSGMEESIPQTDNKQAVVASLPDKSTHPYSSLALSPDRKHAIIAGKDTLQLVKIDAEGLRMIRSIKVGQHFCSSSSTTDSSAGGASSGIRKSGNAPRRYGDVRDAFQLGPSAGRATATANMGNISITKVAWSHEVDLSNTMTSTPGTSVTIAEKKALSHHGEDLHDKKQHTAEETDSFVAVAGSNGAVVVWSARQLLFSEPAKATISAKGRGSAISNTQFTQQPEGILSQHTRAVNSLAWHPKRAGVLLTASQDGSVKLWERRVVVTRPSDNDKQHHHRRPWYSMSGRNIDDLATAPRKHSWFCKATFEPKSEAVRDIKWSVFFDDLFGLVTVSGSLIVYNMHVSVKAIEKIAAHTGDATSLDWHPTRPFWIATGGSGDRTVKVWNLETCLDINRKDLPDHSSVSMNSNTWGTARSEVSMNSQSSSETEKSVPSSVGTSSGPSGYNTIRSTSAMSTGARQKRSSSEHLVYVLSIAAAVTQVQWRPPSSECIQIPSKDSDDSEVSEECSEYVEVDRHDSMLAVATARLTSAGGSGILSLWSFNRPFMSLSIVEGHGEGAVADFVWIQTPVTIPKIHSQDGMQPASIGGKKMSSDPTLSLMPSKMEARGRIRKTSFGAEIEMEDDNIDSHDGPEDRRKELLSKIYIWQHTLSVGRDGRCILQSFVRGDRPISRVPSSCFAMANLSPFQSGYGSLQCFSVYQNVPNQKEDDFMLTGLRQDYFTANAPGVFQENDLQESTMQNTSKKETKGSLAGRRLPSAMPELVFSVVDQGNLDSEGLPIHQDNDSLLCVAPEVVHLSRFARSYKMYPDNECPQRFDLCLYNASVAEDLKCGSLSRMWKTVASILQGSGLYELSLSDLTNPVNPFQYAIFPTIKSLLLERAEAGDVQTCVVLCEVLQVVQTGGTICIPGLQITLVREWYLSYIDLLHQMCLFSAAAYLIKNCNDEAIGGLSQQSTTIHESCPRCGKPLQHSTDTSQNTGNGTKTVVSTSRQACKNCRRRVGMCFLCHEPVKGMFVWCPGCGHGGHLEHALQWFGGSQSGKAVREVCPTGCGHRCNFLQMVSAFPRTDSFKGLPLAEISST